MVEGRGESRIHPRFMVGTIGCAVMSSLRKEIQEVICERDNQFNMEHAEFKMLLRHPGEVSVSI